MCWQPRRRTWIYELSVSTAAKGPLLDVEVFLQQHYRVQYLGRSLWEMEIWYPRAHHRGVGWTESYASGVVSEHWESSEDCLVWHCLAVLLVWVSWIAAGWLHEETSHQSSTISNQFFSPSAISQLTWPLFLLNLWPIYHMIWWFPKIWVPMGTPKSSILIGFHHKPSILGDPLGTPLRPYVLRRISHGFFWRRQGSLWSTCRPGKSVLVVLCHWDEPNIMWCFHMIVIVNSNAVWWYSWYFWWYFCGMFLWDVNGMEMLPRFR